MCLEVVTSCRYHFQMLILDAWTCVRLMATVCGQHQSPVCTVRSSALQHWFIPLITNIDVAGTVLDAGDTAENRDKAPDPREE